MSLHFHPVPLKEVRRETADCVSLLFDIPSDLQQAFAFTQGQSLTLRHIINGEEVRRTYSICSSPLDGEWRVAVKKVPGGIFSTYANEVLKKGDIIELMQPVGRFNTPLDPGRARKYLAIAAGSGITPVLSLIKTTLATEPDSEFVLVYGNRSRQSIIFFEALEALKNKYINRFSVYHILSRERTESALNSGRITKEKLGELKSLINYEQLDECFICGPEAMIFDSKAFLEQNGVNTRKIHFELFTSPGQQQKNKTASDSTGGSEALSRITIRLDGRSIDFDLPLNSNKTLLDAALQQGADLPYACKGGMCCTCKAKLVEGQVSMDVHWGLEEEEVEQGYILTCQSHPQTEKLVVDFDIK